jgi:peptidoglycan-associated lipoprotein
MKVSEIFKRKFSFKCYNLAVLALCSILTFAGSAKADDESRQDESLQSLKERKPWYATVGGGYIFTEKDEQVLGHQLYEIRLGRHLSDRFTLEGGFGGMPYVRARSSFAPGKERLDRDTTGYRFTTDALYHIGDQDDSSVFDPYLGFGGGIIKYDEDVDDGHTELFLAAGPGTFVNFSDTLFAKGDYRVAMVGADTQVNHHVLLSLGYRWGQDRPDVEEKSGSGDEDGRDLVGVGISELKMVHFAFDSANLDQTARYVLKRNAEWLKSNPNKAVTLEGYCDERGSLEYNIALGQRRANAVYNYLRSLGVSEDRLSTVSYGEEYPIDPSHNQGAWAKNRRVQFSLDGKGEPRARRISSTTM